MLSDFIVDEFTNRDETIADSQTSVEHDSI